MSAITLKQDLNEYYACEQWTFKNCKSLVNIKLLEIDPTPGGSGFVHTFEFSDDNDATMFALRWTQ